ncbi:MAG: WecB/TagA/CpsF family glycosyltransferase [Chloroflexi bacterium]|nr:WecB/TagA/CpsF family glycosyltransferase [Chloroflexota bacterium]
MAERYLIVQLADIGDLILSTPALAALREAKPDAHITLLTSAHAAPVVQGTTLVDDIVTFDRNTFNSSASLLKPANLRRIFGLGHFDTVVFFHHFTLKLGTFKFALIALATRAHRRLGLDNGNGWFLTDRLPDGGFGAKHQAQYWLDLVGLLGADALARPAVVATEVFSLQSSAVSCQLSEAGSQLNTKKPKTENRKLITNNSELGTRNSELDSALSTQHSALTIALHPGSGGYSLARRWDADRFAAVADALHDEFGAQIVLVGGRHDDTAAVKAAMKTVPLDLSGQTTLPQLAGVLAQADLFIGADSGVMHLAAAVGTPVVAIFGPSNADAWGPWTPNGKSIIVRSGVECSPCSYVGHSIGLREGCAARTSMRLVTTAMVLRAARRLLNGEAVGTRYTVSLRRQPVFPNRVRILGLPVDAITYEQWLTLIGEWVNSTPPLAPLPEFGEGKGVGFAHHVCTINPEFVMVAQRDPNFFNILNRADLCVPDGVGLLWAARHLGHPLPERVTGSDGVPRIAERAAQTGWRLFLLGAAPGVAEKAAEVLRQQYPGVTIVGTYGGSPAPEEEDAIVERVNASGADILFVAYGAPEQDKWIARNLPRLKVAMAMGVGGSLDFIAGIVPRAPLWMQRAGLEWLFRLYLQPWRFKRMLRLPRFVLAVLLRGAGTNRPVES